MEKMLEIKTEYRGGKYYLQIVKQKFRYRDFYRGKNCFVASNKIDLTSYDAPMFEDGFYCQGVRGRETSGDNKEFNISRDLVDKIEIAVNEYNKSFENDNAKEITALKESLKKEVAEIAKIQKRLDKLTK